VIFGFGAALGWGFADLWAAIAGRRIGSGRTVVISQVVGAIALSLIVLVAAPDLDRLGSVAGWLAPNALLAAAAYACLYHGLELGPIAVVSPVLASYAVIPVLLAVVLLGESLGPWQATGVAVTIGGAVLTSTDVRALREGTATRPAGLPWAVAASVLFGVAAFVSAWASQEAGFLPSLWFARLCNLVIFAVAGLVIRSRPPEVVGRRELRWAIALAAAIGIVDMLGTLAYVRGTEVGLVSVVTAVSATYPLLPVLGGVALLKERPGLTQYFGVAMVVGGLALLGAS